MSNPAGTFPTVKDEKLSAILNRWHSLTKSLEAKVTALTTQLAAAHEEIARLKPEGSNASAATETGASALPGKPA